MSDVGHLTSAGMNRLRTNTEKVLFFSLLIFAPFAFGSVHIWEYSIVCIVALVLFNLRFLGNSREAAGCGENAGRRPPTVHSLIPIFLAINVLYIIPVPSSWIKVINPALYDMRESYMLSFPDMQTLSVYPRATVSYLIKLTGYILVYFFVFSKSTSTAGEGDQKRPRSIYPAFLMLGAVMGVFSILLHSFVDFNLNIPANALYFTVLLAIIAAISVSGERQKAKGGSEEALRLNYPFLTGITNTIIITGFIVAVFGLIQHFSWNGRMFWLVPKPGCNFGPYVCYNHFAGFMEMTGFMALACFYSGVFLSPMRHMKKLKHKAQWLSSKDANKTLLYLFASIVITGALFICSSRGGIVSFSITFMIFVVICVLISPASKKIKYGIFSALVTAAFIWMIVWLGPAATIARFEKLLKAVETLRSGQKVFWLLRPYIWIDTVNMIRHFPLTGVGLGCYSEAFMSFRTFPAGWGFLRYAHQDYLNLLAETGAVGGVFLGVFAVWYFRKFGECITKLRRGAERL